MDKWASGDFKANTVKDVCVQINYLIPGSGAMGVEDCLYLNVYRPKETFQSFSLIPVMVYIHGGGLFAGYPTPNVVGPEYFMDNRNVILVVGAYRLGAMGFLSTGDNNAPGNLGFKDQLVTLKWVKRNIEYFGGDPNSVTIFGNSAGAWSVHLHMLSPASNGYFHRAIIMSGSAIAPYAYVVQNPLKQAKKLAGFLNITYLILRKTDCLIEELRKVDAVILTEACRKFQTIMIDPLTEFRAVVETSGGNDAFLVKDPIEIVKDGEFNFVPLLITFVPNEGIVRAGQLFSLPEQRDNFNQNYSKILPHLLEIENNSVSIHRILNRYFNDKVEISVSNYQNISDASISIE